MFDEAALFDLSKTGISFSCLFMGAEIVSGLVFLLADYFFGFSLSMLNIEGVAVRTDSDEIVRIILRLAYFHLLQIADFIDVLSCDFVGDISCQ